MFSHRAILKQALKISWKNKFLWVFGIFATLAIASGAYDYQFFINSFQQSSLDGSIFTLGSILMTLEAIGLFFTGLINLFTFDIITILSTLTVIILIAVLGIAFIWLTTTSQISLVSLSKKIINKRGSIKPFFFKDEFTEAHKHFWPILWLNILFVIASGILISILSLPIISILRSDSGLLSGVYVLIFLIFVPLAVALSLIVRYAIAYKVLEKENFFNSIAKAWKLFTKNWLISLEMGILLFLVSLIAHFVFLVLLSILIYPYLLFAISKGMAVLAIFLMFVSLILLALCSAFVTTFQITSWTGLFLKLQKTPVSARLEKFLGGLSNRLCKK